MTANRTLIVSTGLIVVGVSLALYFALSPKKPETPKLPPPVSTPQINPLGQKQPAVPPQPQPVDGQWLKSIKTALLQSVLQKKPIIVRMTPVCFKNCPSCAAIDRLLAKVNVKAVLKDFVLVHFDMNQFNTEYDVPPSIPNFHSISFFRPDGKPSKTISGIPSEENFLFAAKRSKELVLDNLDQIPPSSIDLAILWTLLKKTGDAPETANLAKEHFATVKATPSELAPVLNDALWLPATDSKELALEFIAKARPKECLAELMLSIEDPMDSVASMACYALGKIGANSAVPALEEKLKSSPMIQAQTAFALGYLKSRSSLPALYAAMDSTNNPAVKDAILRTIECMPEKDAIPHIRKCLTEKMPPVRAYAAKILGLMGDSESVDKLLMMLSDEKEDPMVRHQVTHALARIGTPECGPALADALSSEDPIVSGSAAEAIGWLGLTQYAEKIALLLDRTEPPAAGLAAIALGDLKAIAYAGRLEEMARMDPKLFSAFGAKLALRMLDPAMDRTEIYESLKVGSADVEARSIRAYAARYLGKMKDLIAGKKMVEAMDPEDWYFCREIGYAIFDITGKAIVAPPDDSPDAWEEIKKALEKE